MIACHAAVVSAVGMLNDMYPVAHAELKGALQAAECALLGIWLAMGNGKWGGRLWKSAACIAALTLLREGPRVIWLVLYGMGMHDYLLFRDLPDAVMNWLITACGVAMASMWWPRFTLVRVAHPVQQTLTIQFSIRSMLLLTLVTAVALAIVRLVRSRFDPSHIDSGFAAFCAYSPLLAIYSAGAAVIYVWAGLGLSLLPLRLAIAVVAQLSRSLLLSLAIAESLDGPGLLWLARSQLAETLIVLGSLLVVRSCGYRVLSGKYTHLGGD